MSENKDDTTVSVDKIMAKVNHSTYIYIHCIVQNVMRTVMNSVKISATLPKLGDDYELLMSFTLFAQFLNSERIRINQLLVYLL